MSFAGTYKRKSEREQRSQSATEMLVQPFSCNCGSPGVVICFGNSAEAVRISCLQLSNATPHQQCNSSQAVARGSCRHQMPTAICGVNRTRAATLSAPLGRPGSAPGAKFVTMCVLVMVDNELQYIEGYMDTGAGVSIMSESMAKSLRLDYTTVEPPLDALKPFGEGSLKPVGFIPKVPLRTLCNKHVVEDFYVVADNQLPADKDAYLSLDLIQQLEHLVRVACSECDR